MAYRERPLGGGVVLWRRTVGVTDVRSRILPDGCLDLIWTGSQLVVAGPDPHARWHDSPGGTSYTGLRFAAGTGPAVLGVPADELVDRTVPLEDLWPVAAAATFSEQVATEPVGRLTSWVGTLLRDGRADPTGARVQAMAERNVPIQQMADQLGIGSRQLHRRCMPLFGYGPRRLSRILRMNRALAAARSGVAWSTVAVAGGYADQAHLCRDVLALAGASPTALLQEFSDSAQAASAANRSTGVPSGSWTTA